MESRLHFLQMVPSFFVILFFTDLIRLQYSNNVIGTSVDDGQGTMFMEEIGENEIIPIETEHDLVDPSLSTLSGLERHVRETSETEKISSPKMDLSTTWRSYEEEGSGEDSEEESDEYYDLDQNLEGTFKEEVEGNSMVESTPIIPSRVIPALRSPIFDDGKDKIKSTKTSVGKTEGIEIQPTRPLVLNNNIPNSIAHYDVSVYTLSCLMEVVKICKYEKNRSTYVIANILGNRRRLRAQ